MFFDHASRISLVSFSVLYFPDDGEGHSLKRWNIVCLLELIDWTPVKWIIWNFVFCENPTTQNDIVDIPVAGIHKEDPIQWCVDPKFQKVHEQQTPSNKFDSRRIASLMCQIIYQFGEETSIFPSLEVRILSEDLLGGLERKLKGFWKFE